MTFEEELTEKFAQMDIIELEDIIKNKKEEYTPEAYSIACDQFTRRYEGNPDLIIQEAKEKAAKNILNEIEKELNPPMKWYYFLIWFSIPCSILNLFTSINPEVPIITYLFITALIIAEVFLIQKKRAGIYIFLSLLLIDTISYLSIPDTVLCITYGIYLIINIIYFNNRKHLFK